MNAGKIFQRLIVSGLLSLSVAYSTENIHNRFLDNGLEVIVIENHLVPLVTIEIAVKNGAFVETPEYDGLAHLYEHMFFKANKVIPDQEAWLKKTRELGISFNGTTSSERVNYFFTLPSSKAREGFDFMMNSIRYPLFKQEELERERPVVIGEYDRNESNPYYYLYREGEKKLWYKYYSRKNTIGDRNVILTATVEKMETLKNRYYIPNNSALLISGDITPEEGFALAEEYFGDWERGDDPMEKWPIPPHPPLEKSSVVVVQKPVNVSLIQFAFHGPSASEDMKSTFAADVLSFILDQKNSEFQKNLVDSGIALSASIGYSTLNQVGPIYVQVACTQDKILEARDAVWTELKKLTDSDYFTDEQLETAKIKLETGEIYSREKPSAFIHTVSYWWSVTGIDYYRDYIPNLRKVSREDINNYVNSYISEKPYVMGVIMSEETYSAMNLLDEEYLP